MADILITGATGFVGSHFVEEIQRRGIDARALVRPTSDLSVLRRLGVECVEGHLGDPAALRGAMAGVETVAHLGAVTRALRPATFAAVNDRGTRSVVEAMAAAGVRRLVYLSSLAACGPSNGAPVGPEGEEGEAGEARPLTAYGRSKLAGEIHALGHGAVEAAVLRAPAVYGPRDRSFLPLFRLARRGVLLAIGDTDRRVQLVHVADLATALAEAVARARVTGVFHVAEPTVYRWWEVLDLLAAAVGRRGVRVPVAPAVVHAAARVSQLAARVAGRAVIFDRDKAFELLADGWVCDTGRARSALGFEAAIPLEEGFRATAEWYRSQGWL